MEKQNQKIVVNHELHTGGAKMTYAQRMKKRNQSIKEELAKQSFRDELHRNSESFKLTQWQTRPAYNEHGEPVLVSGWYTMPMVSQLQPAQGAMPWPQEDAYVEHPLFVNDNKALFAYDGEGFDGMAQHISGKQEYDVRYLEDGIEHHVYESGLTQLERLLFESADIAFVDGEVLKAHDNVVQTPYFLRASWIAKQTGSDSRQAESLADSWKELNADEKMVKTFIAWIKKSTLEKALDYFQKMADELKAVTQVTDDIMDLGCQSVEEYEADDTESAPDTQRFHVIDREDWEATPWFWRQDERFKKAMHIIRTADADKLKEIGKHLFKNKPFQGVQLSVAWSEYKIRKAALYPTTRLGAQLLAKKMGGRALWNAIQAHKSELTKQDIRILWDDFKARTADKELHNLYNPPEEFPTPAYLYEEYAVTQDEFLGWELGIE